MKAFAELFERLDQTTKTNEKTAAMSDFFRACLSDDPGTPPRIDAAWAVAYLSGRRSKDTRTRRLVPTRLLRQWAAAEASIPDWLLDESYDRVGDLAETITLLVPEHHNGVVSDRPLSRWLTDHVLPLSGMDESQQRHAVTTMWRESSGTTRLILMKLITGGFRLGVSARLVARGLADATDIPADVIAHRLMGNWKPDPGFLDRLTSTDTDDASCSRPYPFCLAHAVPTSSSDDEKASSTCESLDTIASLGPLNEFIAEWKWDGIRGQVIRRGGQTFVWSRGEDLMEGRFPEVESAAEFLPNGTVLDGEILASCVSTDLAEHPSGIEVLPFAQLQRRIGRKTVGKKLLADVPVMFHAFDCLEFNGIDLREQRLDYRQQVLRDLVADHQPPNLVINP
ncbi:MAG: ATP-dependent DNA ligase, partial [Planctomycetota bacterium]